MQAHTARIETAAHSTKWSRQRQQPPLQLKQSLIVDGIYLFFIVVIDRPSGEILSRRPVHHKRRGILSTPKQRRGPH